MNTPIILQNYTQEDCYSYHSLQIKSHKAGKLRSRVARKAFLPTKLDDFDYLEDRSDF